MKHSFSLIWKLRFVNPKFTPNFADTVDTIKRSLTRTIQKMIDMEEEQSEKQSLDNIWPIYERNLAEIRKEKLKQEELRKTPNLNSRLTKLKILVLK